MKQGLVSLDYETRSHVLRAVYEPDAEYDIRDLIAYVEDMSEGKSERIMIYEHDTLMHDIRRSSIAGWTNVAPHR